MDARRTWAASIIGVLVAGLPVTAAVATPPDDIIEYVVPTPASGPLGITAGPDGNLWFTETAGNKIGRITPDGAITEFPLTGSASYPSSITTGSDGNLWFAGGRGIGRITPAGAVTDYPLPDADSPARDIAAGPDGNLWFTQPWSREIGRITTEGVVTEFPVSVPQPGLTVYPGPFGIAAGPDANMWFTGYEAMGIGRISTDGTATTVLDDVVEAVGITAGPDGNMWAAAGEAVYRITPAGISTGYRGWTDYSSPWEIATGPDGNMWFTEMGLARLGRATPEGRITYYRLPGRRTAHGIAAGPDGNLWFTENLANRIGRISPDAKPTLVRRSCPVRVTLHEPTPRTLGTRTLIDDYATKKSSCAMTTPVVRCKVIGGYPYSGKAACDVTVTKQRTIRVRSKRPITLQVTVILRAKPKPEAAKRWRRGTSRQTWTLR